MDVADPLFPENKCTTCDHNLFNLDGRCFKCGIANCRVSERHAVMSNGVMNKAGGFGSGPFKRIVAPAGTLSWVILTTLVANNTVRYSHDNHGHYYGLGCTVIVEQSSKNGNR